jgi:putative peptide-modifying radical SAM enzyme
MFYYVTLTTDCNLRCRYCYGKCLDDIGSDFGDFEIDYSIPSSISYEIAQLRDFCRKDPDAVIIFYGGEPLMRIDKIVEIMSKVPAKWFMIQTNGLLLDRLEREYANRLHTILVSIDGDEKITDYNRGPGTYRRVIHNVRLLRERGFGGEIIARMTVTQDTDVDRQVLWLLFNDECNFTSVHWQLDAQFWRSDYHRERFFQWVEERYNPQVASLVRTWVSYMQDYGKVLKIYPFIGIMRSLLLRESSRLRCGAGWIEFNIQTDGNISPCPVMAGMKDFYLGNIAYTDPKDLANSLTVSKPCTECEIYSICGGRCLYANITKLWGEEGFKLVCRTVANLVNSLESVLPLIEQLISENKIRLADFDYTKYNSCEIIP